MVKIQFMFKWKLMTQITFKESVFYQKLAKKFFTFILIRRLKSWSEENYVIGNKQAGFREQHTTIDQIFCLYTLITKYLRHKGGCFYALFVDFDRVDHSALWHK